MNTFFYSVDELSHISIRRVLCRGADKSLARPERKQARKHVRKSRDFNNIETRVIIKLFFCCKVRRRRQFTPFWQKY